MNRTAQIAGGVFLLIIIGVLLINPASAQPIKAPYKITTPGTYELTDDARGITDISGISIECSNVVLDGGNHFLGGESRDNSVGVYVNQYGGSLTNVTVKNLLLEKWQTGIDYKYVKGEEGDINQITGCDIVDSETAIHVEYSDYVQVNDNKITGCPTGISVEGLSTYTTLQKNTIKNSGLGVGIINSKYTTIEENNINTCSVYGLQVTDSEYTTITRNGISDNSYAAIAIENSRESDITGNTLTKTTTGPVLNIGNEVRYASITDNYFGSYENVLVDAVSSDIAWNSTQAPGTNILGGPYMGGNYWGSAPGDKGFSDTAPDQDGYGIADKPYQINEYNIDYLPLTHTTATKAPEDQVSNPVMPQEDNQTIENQTPAAEPAPASPPVSVPDATNLTESPVSPAPAIVNVTSNETSQIRPMNTTGNTTVVQVSSPVNQTPEPEPVQTPPPGNGSIMNHSVTNAYPSGNTTISADTVSEAANLSVQNQTPDQGMNENSANGSAPAPVGYLVFNVSESGFQVTLKTATGTDVSLDQAEGNLFTVPVPVEGLVYTSYRVSREGYSPVSGNISPYPSPGQTISIPVTLVPVNTTTAPASSPAIEQVALSTISPVQGTTPSPTLVAQKDPVNTTVQTSSPVVPVVPPANLSSSASPAEPVVVSNGVALESEHKTPHSIRASAGPGGSIVPSGDVQVPDGDSLAFTIEPREGHRVSYLIVDGIQTGPMSEYRFIGVTGDHTIVAGFT